MPCEVLHETDIDWFDRECDSPSSGSIEMRLTHHVARSLNRAYRRANPAARAQDNKTDLNPGEGNAHIEDLSEAVSISNPDRRI